jgi:hypothetical protein
MTSLRQGKPRPERWKETHMQRPRGSQDSGVESAADATPVQAWRAWADCGDGRQVHLILDPQAQQVWLLPADDTHLDPRSMQ